MGSEMCIRDSLAPSSEIQSPRQHEDGSHGKEGRREGRKEGGITCAPAFLTSEPQARTAPASPDATLFAEHPHWVMRGDIATHPLDLWPLAAVAPRIALDAAIFTALATRHDALTGGNGWYWVGHAILIAGMAGAPIRTPKMVAVIVGRWGDEDSYGSDTESFRERAERRARVPAPARVGVTGAGASNPSEQGNTTPLPSAPLSEAQSGPQTTAHPAVDTYITVFGRHPNAEQVERIVATVTDMAAWRRVLADWQANGWNERGVVKMIDRYTKEAVGVNPEAPADIRWIYRHPDLTCDERAEWLHMFRVSLVPADQRAVVARLLRERPTTEDDLLV